MKTGKINKTPNCIFATLDFGQGTVIDFDTKTNNHDITQNWTDCDEPKRYSVNLCDLGDSYTRLTQLGFANRNKEKVLEFCVDNYKINVFVKHIAPIPDLKKIRLVLEEAMV